MTTKTNGKSPAQGDKPIQNVAQPTGLPDEDYYAEQFRSNDLASISGLSFAQGFDPRPYQFRYFTFVDADKDAKRIARDFFVKVTRDGGIGGCNFADMFTPDAFGEDGLITDGKLWDKASHKSQTELILYCRPIQAYKARQRVEAENSDKLLKAKTGKELQDEMKSGRGSEFVTITTDIGDDSSPW